MGLQEITKLREMTGAGMMDCKNSLDESNGDLEKAADLLRKKGIVKAAKRADKVAAEGAVQVKVDGNFACVLEVNSETDFVAKNEQFQNLVNELLDYLLEAKPANLEDAMASKMENGKTVEEYVVENSGQIGEKISLRRFEIMEKGDNDSFGAYLHMGGNIGVLSLVKDLKDDDLARDISMHVAASNPKYLKKEEVSKDDLKREEEIYRVQLAAEGKPENLIDNIIKGKMNKYYSENCLMQQSFIKDETKTVTQILKDAGSENTVVEKFIRFELGEGIEKEECDYVAEIEAQM